MASKEELKDWIVEALKTHGGAATLIDVCKSVWARHEDELRESGNLFYTWQYDIRWAATKLRQAGQLKDASDSPRGVWELS